MRYAPTVTALLFALLPAGCATMGGHVEHRAAPSGVPTYAEEVNWHTLAEGSEMARRSKKPMVVDFAVPDGCDRCDFLQDNVYSKDVIVEKLHSDFIPIWVNLGGNLTEEEKALGEEFDYRNDCLLLFLDHAGRVIEDPEGKKLCFVDEVTPEDFMKYLDNVKTEYVPAD